jgi:hypothetical protein
LFENLPKYFQSIELSSKELKQCETWILNDEWDVLLEVRGARLREDNSRGQCQRDDNAMATMQETCCEREDNQRDEDVKADDENSCLFVKHPEQRVVGAKWGKV